jgi:tetratricopeptide (TPR) repeat protein
MNKNYDWNETNISVTITFPLLYKIDKKKFDYTITDSYIKLNLYQMKQFHFIDLMNEVDTDSSQIILEENKIIFNLVKKENVLWKKLESNLPKEELKERRKKADERLEEKIKKKRELAENKKKEFEKFVVDKSIKIDDEFREELRNKKQEEKINAEKDLYKFVDKIDNNKIEEEENEDEDDSNINTNTNNNINQQIEEEKNNEIIKEEENINNKNETKDNTQIKHSLEKDPYEEENKKQKEEKDAKPIKHSIESRRNQIFSDELEKKPKKEKFNKEAPLKIESPMVASNNFQNTLQALLDKKEKEEEKEKNPPPQQQSDIRKQETIKVNLTKKLIPTFSARESLSKEPPYPKSKKYVPEKNYLGQEIDEKNPIWAKQRGDNFYNNKDYSSAINAYNNALDLDPYFHKVLINRGTCYMCLGQFDQALNDFYKAIDLIDNIDKKERSDAFYDRINVKALSKIYAIHALRQEYQKALDVINDKLLLKEHAFPFIIPEDKWKKIEKDKNLIESRMSNEKLKEEGDNFLRQKNYENAEKIYNQILNIEPNNERVLSNLSMIYLFQEKYDEVINICTKILNIFSKFKERIKIKNMNNLFEIKILLRRAKCYEIKNDMEKAQKDIESIEKLSITNPSVLKEVKEIKDKLKIHVVDTYKQKANEHLQKQEFSEALSFYNKAIDVVKFSNIYNKIDLVKILLNRTSCFIKLTQYDNTFIEFERILNILSKQKAIADLQSNIILSDEVKKLEFTTLAKRAYVYSINNKIEDAIKDYNRALELRPGDIKIKENLAKLKAIER